MPIPLQVIETGGRCVYHVRSEANPSRVYTVDILAHGSAGECICKDWQTRRWPTIRDGGRDFCKHVMAARTYFLDQVLREMARMETEPKLR